MIYQQNGVNHMIVKTSYKTEHGITLVNTFGEGKGNSLDSLEYFMKWAYKQGYSVTSWIV